MSEHDNDGFYWKRRTTTLFARATCCSTSRSRSCPSGRFVLGEGHAVETQSFDDYPENVPSDLIVVEALFGALSMIVTPTCHVSEGEKDEDIISVVPVAALNLVVADIAQARAIRAGKNVPLHLFSLPRSDLGGGILGFHAVALLDRPASMRKHNLRDYRRLGLYLESRIKLRKALARFWARGDASDSIERSMRPQIDNRRLEDLE